MPEFRFLVSFMREQKTSRQSHLILGTHLISRSFIKRKKKKSIFLGNICCSVYENKTSKHPRRCWEIHRDENQSKDFACHGGLLQEESIVSKSRKPSVLPKRIRLNKRGGEEALQDLFFLSLFKWYSERIISIFLLLFQNNLLSNLLLE